MPILFIFLSLLFAGFSPAWTAAPTLNVYSWAGYLPETVLRQFTQETGIKVHYSSYDSNETLYAKLKTNPNIGYDVIIPSSYCVARMAREGMLHKLDKAQLRHLNQLNPDLLDKIPPVASHYSAPYLWTATGILANTRYYPTADIQSWHTLWAPRFKSQLLLLDDMREVFSIALLRLGYSPNTRNAQEIQAAYQALKQLMPNIKVFSTEGIAALYIGEDLKIGMGWNGNANRVIAHHPSLQFGYPKEGYILSVDSLAIPIGAKHIKAAYQLINFLLRPDIAATVTLHTGYATPNLAAREYLPAEYLANPRLYPDADTLKRGIIQTDVGEQLALYEKYWAQLKVEG